MSIANPAMKTFVSAKVLFGIGLSALFCLGTYATWQFSRSTKTEIVKPIAQIEPQVVALGEILPQSRLITVAAPTGMDVGRILDIRVAEGDNVTKGTVLATLDTQRSLAALLVQAQSNIQQKRAALAKLRADLLSDEKTLQSQVEQQKTERDRAQWDFDKYLSFVNEGIYSKAALIDKRLALELANDKLQSAELSLARNRMTVSNGIRVSEASALAEISTAKAAVLKARADLDKAYIRAPISGRILSLKGKIGEQVSSSGFAQIGDVSTMLVRAEVFETDLGQLKPAMACKVRSQAISGALTGKITRLGTLITKQSIISTDPAENVDARVVEVWIKLDASSSKRVADRSNLQVQVIFDTVRHRHA